MSLTTKIRAYVAIIRSTLLYGRETWVFKVQDYKKLEQTSMVKSDMNRLEASTSLVGSGRDCMYHIETIAHDHTSWKTSVGEIMDTRVRWSGVQFHVKCKVSKYYRIMYGLLRYFLVDGFLKVIFFSSALTVGRLALRAYSVKKQQTVFVFHFMFCVWKYMDDE